MSSRVPMTADAEALREAEDFRQGLLAALKAHFLYRKKRRGRVVEATKEPAPDGGKAQCGACGGYGFTPGMHNDPVTCDACDGFGERATKETP